MARREVLGPGEIVRVRTTKSPCPIVIVGFAKYRSSSAHSFDALGRILDDAMSLCARKWNWSIGKSSLAVRISLMGRSMGRAYGPGLGYKKYGVRIISLNARLLSDYDADSVRRVIFHELCHHYREEAFVHGSYHDRIFCRELAKVDEILARQKKKGCTYFDDVMDLEFQNKVMRKKGLETPIWLASAGIMLFDTTEGSKYQIEWKPRGRNYWVLWRKPVSFRLLLALARAFPPTEYKRVKVLSKGYPVKNLLDVFLYLIRRHPMHCADLIAWLNTKGRTALGSAVRGRKKPKKKTSKRRSRRK